ncbi:heat shock protein HSP70 [Reticulomyxa filosa]|uniref:Heat shock protein HSP70 n=1 Tax=Reticulomyxa filosa TaxID=46433 RepID=X6NDT5_RETFI|nr:heat shock protein HSP70 [Reticulomyxa filosa]|eukprot:ETO24161.1 heat shock protein HSP70 [Reticulomyxa filosa]
MSGEVFDQVIGIDFGSFGSAAVACEHVRPGVVPRIDLIQHVTGHTLKSDYAKSKNLSALLLERETKSVVCWGYSAEEKYLEKKQEERDKYAYFANFKLAALTKDAKFRSKKIKDSSKTFEMPVMDLFIMILKIIKETALEKRKRIGKIGLNFVLPSKFSQNKTNNKNTEVMRECGKSCGMHHVEICFESIAATFAVISHSQSREVDETKRLRFFEDDQVVLLDMGGGTIDAACLTFLEDEKMAETHHRDGLDIGGMMIDQAFEDLLADIFGSAVISEFQQNNPQAWLQQRNEFWTAKHSLREKEQRNVELTRKFRKHLQDTFKSLDIIGEKLQAYDGINGKPSLEGNFLQLSYETWLHLHEQILHEICGFVSKLLDHERVKPKVLIVTGGFSGCPFVIPRLRQLLSEREDPPEIYQPHNPHESVVRGSVLWAINQKDLSYIRAPLTLGWCVDKIWYPGDPDDDHKVSSFESYTGYIRKKCFKEIIRRDQRFEDGTEHKQVYVLPRQKKAVEFTLYKSKLKDGIHYCDDESVCQPLKTFRMFFKQSFSEQVNFELTITLRSNRVELSYKHPNTGRYQPADVKFGDENVEDIIKIGGEFENVEIKEDTQKKQIKKETSFLTTQIFEIFLNKVNNYIQYLGIKK